MTAASDSKQEHLASPALLRKIDQLRELNIGQHVSLPQLVVVGDQSSGKSSLLENLTGIPFPRNVELCTRYATQITSRRDTESVIQVTIIPGPQASEEHKKRLGLFTHSVASGDNFGKRFPKILKQANERMGIRMTTSQVGGTVFSEDVLKIEIRGPTEDYLTVIDVPGIFRSPTEGVTTKEDMVLVRKLVTSCIKNERTIILAVLPSNVDIATQEILSLAADYDKTGERTLAVLTKPDLVQERSAKEAVCNLVRGKKNALTLGYFVVRNRGADEDDSSEDKKREDLFQQQPWCTLPPDRVGTQALKTRLGDLLGQITRNDFPKLRREISDQLEASKKQLHSLGPSRHTETEQRAFLSSVAGQFQDITRAALDAQYARSPIFDGKDELRLITLIVGKSSSFNHDFEEHGAVWKFETIESSSQAPEPEPGFNPVSLGQPWTTVQQDFGAPLVAGDYAELDSILHFSNNHDKPKLGIMSWIKKLYTRSRGMEMGTFGGEILSSAFKEQSNRWESLTKEYLSAVIMLIHRFITLSLSEICTDPQVRGQLWQVIVDEILKRYHNAMMKAEFLVSLERNKRAYTLNHYFNENLQKVRADRAVQRLRVKAHKELEYSKNGYTATGPLVVQLDDVQRATVDKDNAKHVEEEIHDILKAYYKVARKRIVDNVFDQAVDYCLLTGPESPLAVLTQEWVINLNAEQLEEIAKESIPTKARREQLAKKIRGLEAAVKILRH